MYWRHFNLTAEPFSLTPDPSFLYLSPVHAEAYAALMMGLRERRGLTTMIGEVGTGKTTLVYSVLGGLGPEINTAYVSNARLSFDGILRATLRDFGVPCDSTSSTDLTDALNAFLLDCAEKGTTAAMVIDEAQNLSPETFEDLRLLTNFETYTHKLLQIVLVGQPELDTKLRNPALRQVLERVAVQCVVNPLNRRESRAYLEHRLAAVNGSPNIFTRPALQLLVARSRGIPRSLNILAHNAMLFAYGEASDRVSRRFVAAAVREKEGRALVRLWQRSPRTTSVGRINKTKSGVRSSFWRLSAAAACGMVVGLAIAGGDHLMARLATPAAKATATQQAATQAQEVATLPSVAPQARTAEPEPTPSLFAALPDEPAPLVDATPALAPAALPSEPAVETEDTETPAATADAPAAALDTQESAGAAETDPTPPPAQASPSDSATAEPEKNVPAAASADSAVVKSAPQPRTAEVAAAAAPTRNPRPAPAARPAAPAAGTRASAPRPRATTLAAAARPATRPAPTAPATGAGSRAQGSAAPQDRVRVIKVPPGSSLSGLLLTVYGQYSSEMIDRVKAVNPQVSDPDFIIAGDKLRFPDASQEQSAGSQEQR